MDAPFSLFQFIFNSDCDKIFQIYEIQVLDLLEDACESLLESIIQENPHIMGS